MELVIKYIIKLKNPINCFIGDKVFKQIIYQAKITKNNIKDLLLRVYKELNIIKNYLIEDNQAILTKYLAILKPLQITIKRLKRCLKENI